MKYDSLAEAKEAQELRAAVSATRRRWLWGAAAVVVTLVVGGVSGAAIEHSADQGQAAASLYRSQVESTIVQFMRAEQQLMAKPAAQRDATVLSDLADSLTAGAGGFGGGPGTLEVDQGAGALSADQVVWTVVVSSPYGDSSFVVWDVDPDGPSEVDQGVCVLASTLLGSGTGPDEKPTTQALGLSDTSVAPCQADFWTTTDPSLPQFGRAGIHKSGYLVMG